MVILSKGQKDINRITVNHTPLSNFTNIQGLSSNFAECESFVESNFPDILALCEKKLEWLNWFWQFLFEGLSSFNLLLICMDKGFWKVSVTHMHGFAVSCGASTSFYL